MSLSLTSVTGIGPAAAKQLKSYGFSSAESIAAATVDDLLQVPGFGQARAVAVIQAAKAMLPAGVSSQLYMGVSEGDEIPPKKKKAGKKKDKGKKKDEKGKKKKKGKKRGDGSKKGKKGKKGKKSKKGKKKKK